MLRESSARRQPVAFEKAARAPSQNSAATVSDSDFGSESSNRFATRRVNT